MPLGTTGLAVSASEFDYLQATRTDALLSRYCITKTCERDVPIIWGYKPQKNASAVLGANVRLIVLQSTIKCRRCCPTRQTRPFDKAFLAAFAKGCAARGTSLHAGSFERDPLCPGSWRTKTPGFLVASSIIPQRQTVAHYCSNEGRQAFLSWSRSVVSCLEP